ncbi:MAG: lysophospholipase [Anaerolineae bacterium]|nr:lysophospholipase [Anaerolineae bacterium]
MAARTHHETRFPTRDNLSLYEHWWLPDLPAKAAIVLVHGLGEHSGRYSDVAANLNAAGYAVYTYDQRGHGRSQGQRSYFGRFDQLSADLDIVMQRVRNRIDDLPLFLMGHSVGGTVVAAYAIAYQPDVKGIALSSAALKPGESLSPAAIAISGVISRFMPRTGLVALDASTISRDPAEVQAYNDDPLVFRGKLPARTGAELLAAFKFIQDEAYNITAPILIWHGTADRLTNPEGSRQLFERVGSADKTLKLYEGAYHETLNDLDRDQVINDLIGWLDQRFSQ